MKQIAHGKVSDDSPVPRLYEAVMDLCHGAEVAIREAGNVNPNLQLNIPIYMGDDLIVTIEKGPETAAKVAIFKAQIDRGDE
jgi:hypothetical protein